MTINSYLQDNHLRKDAKVSQSQCRYLVQSYKTITVHQATSTRQRFVANIDTICTTHLHTMKAYSPLKLNNKNKHRDDVPHHTARWGPQTTNQLAPIP